MNLKTYRAASVADALSEIKRDLGVNAVILHTRTIRKGGIFGFRARQFVEITASSDVKVRGPRVRQSQESPPVRESSATADAARRAYAAASAQTEEPPQPPAPAPEATVRKERVATATRQTQQ